MFSYSIWKLQKKKEEERIQKMKKMRDVKGISELYNIYKSNLENSKLFFNNLYTNNQRYVYDYERYSDSNSSENDFPITIRRSESPKTRVSPRKKLINPENIPIASIQTIIKPSRSQSPTNLKSPRDNLPKIYGKKIPTFFDNYKGLTNNINTFNLNSSASISLKPNKNKNINDNITPIYNPVITEDSDNNKDKTYKNKPSSPSSLEINSYRYRNHELRKIKPLSKQEIPKNLVNSQIVNSISLKEEKTKKNLSMKFPKILAPSPNSEKMKIHNKLKPFYLPIEQIVNARIKPYVPYFKSKAQKDEEKVYYYHITKHYRNQFIQYFSHRKNWKHVDKNKEKQIYILGEKIIPVCNLRWKFDGKTDDFTKLKYDIRAKPETYQMLNIFEKFEQIGNKNWFFLNLLEYCDSNNVNVFDIVPMTIIINNGKSSKNLLNKFKELIKLFSEVASKNPTKDISTNKLYGKIIQDKENPKKFLENLQNTFVFIPHSFLSEKNYWIIKPNDLYQGKCIEISNDFNELAKHIQNLFSCGSSKKKSTSQSPPKQSQTVIDQGKKKKKNRNNRHIPESIVVQKYLDKPLLYQKRKFDIRCYVLVDFSFNVFFCREGHLKASSKEYDINSLDYFVHITNYSLQKRCEEFSKFEYGNEISYDSFRQFLEEQGESPSRFEEALQRMRTLIKISMLSVGSKKLSREKNVFSFQIFGYDFILDEDFKPWILEINDNPGFSISSPVIAKIIPRMFDDAMRLTIDKVFDTVYDKSVLDEESKIYKSKYPLKGYSDYENIFEFLGNIANS